MDIFQIFSNWLILDFLNLKSSLGTALNFFIYDSLKILFLLLVINFFMAIVRYYLPIEKIKSFLTLRKWYGLDYFLAALFGTITPFCSCSSIPLFIGFLEVGIPLGVTFTFLIVSPLVNEVAVVLFLGLFGLKITVFYVFSAIILGMVSGFMISKLKLEKEVSVYILKNKKELIDEEKKVSFLKLIKLFWSEGFEITKKLALYVFLGIGVGALIHGFIPIGFFEKYITADNLFSVPIATILAVPLYSNSMAVIPIMESLVGKGIPFGTAMAFMMAVVALSLPEALILRKVMKKKLLLIFFGIVTINIVIIGYLFNFLLDKNVILI